MQSNETEGGPALPDLSRTRQMIRRWGNMVGRGKGLGWESRRVCRMFANTQPKTKSPDGDSVGALVYRMFHGGRRWYRTTDPLLVRQVLSP